MNLETAIRLIASVKMVDAGMKNAQKIVLDAARLQIPTAPIHNEKGGNGCTYWEWLCPTCNAWLSSIYRDSICRCGQRLDWEEVLRR